MTDNSSLEKMLSTCLKQENMRAINKLKQAYETLPDLIKSTSQMMDIDAEKLVGLSYRVTCTRTDLNVYDVIHVLYLFDALQKRDEDENNAEKQ